jgi:5-methylcytosine-specific restriction protein A
MPNEQDLSTQRPGGVRNPPWERDELILALDLYLEAGLIDHADPRVLRLSELLNRLPLHPVGGDDRFRNPNSVHLKLANFAAVDPAYSGGGMTHVGRRDREVWQEFTADPGRVQDAARAIRQEVDLQLSEPLPPFEDEELADEGRLLFRRHRVRERNRRLTDRKKDRVLTDTGALACEACRFEFGRTYGDHGTGYIECHHIVPLAAVGQTRTRLSDLALVCANCHRMLHKGTPSPSIEQLAAMIGSLSP